MPRSCPAWLAAFPACQVDQTALPTLPSLPGARPIRQPPSGTGIPDLHTTGRTEGGMCPWGFGGRTIPCAEEHAVAERPTARHTHTHTHSLWEEQESQASGITDRIGLGTCATVCWSADTLDCPQYKRVGLGPATCCQILTAYDKRRRRRPYPADYTEDGEEMSTIQTTQRMGRRCPHYPDYTEDGEEVSTIQTTERMGRRCLHYPDYRGGVRNPQ